MRLILRLSLSTRDIERTHIFTEQGGTIGRADDNSWVLVHPKVSTHHAIVSYSDGQFYIEATSDLGVLVNYVREIGDRPYPLKSGDRLFIEPYEIEVLLDTKDERAAVDVDDDPFGLPSDSGAELPPPESASSEPDELDPLALIKPVPWSARPSRPSDRPVDDSLSEHDAPPAAVPSAPRAPNGHVIPEGYNPLDDEPRGPSFPGPPPMEAAREDAVRRHEEEQRRQAEAARKRREGEARNREQERREAGAQHQRHQEEQRRLREQEVRELIARAEQTLRKGEYEAALAAARKAAALDPTHRDAGVLQVAIREAAEERLILERAAQAERVQDREEETGQWLQAPERTSVSAPDAQILITESSTGSEERSPRLWWRLKDFFTPWPSSRSVPKDSYPSPTDAEIVSCTVFAPPRVARGSSFLLQVFAHKPHDDRRARRLAASYDPAAKPRGKSRLNRSIARGTELTLVLAAPGVTVDEPVQRLVWQSAPESVQFGITVPTDFGRAETFIGTVSIADGSVPVGRVKFVIRVVSATVSAPVDLPDQSWARYRHAFVSYAAEDRVEVLKRVQMLDRVKIDFFHDLLSLEPGERWARALYKNIDKSDVFFLFWSSNAKRSKWVLREVRYAIDLHRGDDLARPEIVPVLIEGPPPVPPPPELKDLHFNDKFVYFIAGSS